MSRGKDKTCSRCGHRKSEHNGTLLPSGSGCTHDFGKDSACGCKAFAPTEGEFIPANETKAEKSLTKFWVESVDAKGSPANREVEAETREEAITKIQAMGLYPTKVQEVKDGDIARLATDNRHPDDKAQAARAEAILLERAKARESFARLLSGRTAAAIFHLSEAAKLAGLVIADDEIQSVLTPTKSALGTPRSLHQSKTSAKANLGVILVRARWAVAEIEELMAACEPTKEDTEEAQRNAR